MKVGDNIWTHLEDSVHTVEVTMDGMHTVEGAIGSTEVVGNGNNRSGIQVREICFAT